MIAAMAFIKQCQAQQIGVQPILLLHGDEPLHSLQALGEYRTFLRQAGYLQRDRYEVDGQFNWQELQMDTQAGSLFAEQRIIELDMPKGNPGKDGTAFILNWLQFISATAAASLPEICLIIRCEKLDSRQLKSKWVQAIEASGLVVQSLPIEKRALPAWCEQKAQALGITLSAEAARLLAERVEGNMLAADQEIEKLSLYFAKGTVLEAQHILDNVADQAHYQLFGLATAVLLGQTGYALQVLKRLEQESLEAPIVLWMLAKEVKQCLALAQMQQSRSLAQVFTQLKIWRVKQGEYSAALKRHSLADWQKMLQKALAIDLTIKGVRQGDPWLGLADLVFVMARKSA